MISKLRKYSAFTLVELLAVVFIISLFVLSATVNLYGVLNRNTFAAQAREFVSTMEMAAAAAAQSSRRYEVIIDLTEQFYVLREITSSDLSEILMEDIIVDNDFSVNCIALEVYFDDGDYTNEGRAKFRAGHSGWQYGGKIVLLGNDGREYSVLVNRISRTVKLEEGNSLMLEPRFEEEMLF
jgi:type II secretory pathway pseudopilin PulG